MKRLLAFLFLLVAIALLVAIPLLRLDHYRTQIAESLSQRLGHRVIVGRLEAVFFPPAVRLRDVAIMNQSGDAPLLQAEQITAPINWPALLHGTVAPDALNIRGWTAVVHRRPNGTWAWDEWLGPTAHLSEKAGWPVRTITFDRGEARAVDAYGPGPAEFIIQILQGGWEGGRHYISANGVFTSLPTPVSFLFQGTGDFLSQGEWAGVLGLNDESRQLKLDFKVSPTHITGVSNSALWRFDTAYTALRYYGRLPVDRPVASPNVVLQGWEGHYDWQGSTLSVTQTATLSGGRAEAKSVILFSAGAPKARLDLGLQSAKIQPIEAAMLGSAPLEGTATGLVHFELSLTSSSWETLNGQGALEVIDGKYFLPNASTQGLAKAHTMRYLLKKYPGFLTNGVSYTKASVQWQVHNGVFSFNNAFSDLGDIRVAAAGTYDASRHGLDAYARVQINERNKALIKELPPTYVSSGEGMPHIQPMNGRVQGSLGEWRLRVTRGSKIPPAVQNKLSRAIRTK